MPFVIPEANKYMYLAANTSDARLPGERESVVPHPYNRLGKLVSLNLIFSAAHWFALVVPSPTPSISVNTN